MHGSVCRFGVAEHGHRAVLVDQHAEVHVTAHDWRIHAGRTISNWYGLGCLNIVQLSRRGEFHVAVYGDHIAATLDTNLVTVMVRGLPLIPVGYGKLSKRHSFRNRDGLRRDVDVVAVAQTAYEKDSAVCTPSRLFAVPVARHVGDTAKQYLLRWFRPGLVQPHVEIRTERHRGIKAL